MQPVQAIPIVDARYQRLEFAGRGGMGTVYRALDTFSGEPVAIKVMRDDMTDEGLLRFDREAAALRALDHPAIVRYIDAGRSADGRPYLVMEWLNGTGMDVAVAREPLSLSDGLAVAQRIASALTVIHAAGLIHRDLKPSNILLVDGKPGRAKLIDFGLVRGASLEAMTQAGMALGTPGYMSPEQIRGATDIDARADLYALGCVLFKLLTGRQPFQYGDQSGLITRPLFEDAPRLSARVRHVPPLLDQLVAALLMREPSGRPANATIVQNTLADVLFELREDAVATEGTTRSLGQDERRTQAVIVLRLPADLPPSVDAMTELATPASDVSYHGTVFGDAELLAPELALHDTLLSTVAPFGGQLLQFDHGVLAVTVRPGGTASDQAGRALRCALAVREAMGVHPLAIGLLRRDATQGAEKMEPGDPLQALVGLLNTAGHTDVVRMDEVCALLLATRAPVGQDEVGHYLDPERAGQDEGADDGHHLLPCMGRDRELATLEGLWNECIDDECARVALVTGAAGIGKTRLVKEFLARTRRNGATPQVWLAATDELGAGLPYGVIQRATARAAGLHGVTGEQALPLWKTWLSGIVPASDVESTANVLASLGALAVGSESMAGGALQSSQATLRVDHIQLAIEKLLAAVCAKGPLLVVLEDVHWADAASLRLFEGALRKLAELPWMVVALSRPELLDAFPRLWQQAAPQQIALAGLTPKAASRLVKSALGDQVSEAAVQRLVAHAGGNAFYLEELVRAVREGRGDVIPATVLATVESRLLGLDPDARRLLRAASVIGQAFSVDALTVLLGGSHQAQDELAWLEPLVRADLLRHDEHSGLFRFAHALVHEAAYATLTDIDRTKAHLLAAGHLQGTGVQDPLRMAHHYALGGDQVAAARCLAQAARQLLMVGDKEAARQHACAAIAQGQDSDFVGEAHFIAGEACRQLGRSDEAQSHTAAAVARLPVGSQLWYAAQRTVVMVGMSSFYGRR